MPAAVREMEEELGLRVRPEELTFIGVHRGAFEAEFYGRMFRDNELSYVYLYTGPVDVADLKLQEEEVESVLWMDYEECRQQVEAGTLANCIYLDEFRMCQLHLSGRVPDGWGSPGEAEQRAGKRTKKGRIAGGGPYVASEPVGKRMDDTGEKRTSGKRKNLRPFGKNWKKRFRKSWKIP